MKLPLYGQLSFEKYHSRRARLVSLENPVETIRNLRRAAVFAFVLGNIFVKNVGGSPIRLRDIGHAEDDITGKRSFAC